MYIFDEEGKKKRQRVLGIYCSGGYGGALVIILLLIQLFGGYA